MKTLPGLLWACVGAALVSFATAWAGEPAPSPKVAHAISLLDEWSGQGELLAAARKDLIEALAANPNDVWAHREMARFHIMSGFIAGKRVEPQALALAKAELDAAVALQPDFAPAHVLLGHWHWLSGQMDQGLEALRRAEALGTTDPYLHVNRAAILFETGKVEEARAQYEKALESGRDRAATAALEGLIKCYTALGQLDKVEEAHRKVLALRPDAAWPYGNYARFLLCQRDDFAGAVQTARKGLSLMRYGLGQRVLAAALYREWAEGKLAGKPDAQLLREAEGLHGSAGGMASQVLLVQTCGKSAALDKVRAAWNAP